MIIDTIQISEYVGKSIMKQEIVPILYFYVLYGFDVEKCLGES